MMSTRIFRACFLLAILSGCATTTPEIQTPPDGLSWSPVAPFRDEPKTDLPSDAFAVNHFLIGQMLLGEGDFEAALKEFEAASRLKPDDAFLRFRLASLYLRKGDLKEALVAAE